MVIWREDLKILHKGIVLVAMPLALNLLILGASTFLLYMLGLETKREGKSKDFNRLVNTVQRCYIAAGLSTGLKVLIAAGVAANLALSVWLALFFERSIRNRLLAVMANTSRLAEGAALGTARQNDQFCTCCHGHPTTFLR